MVTLQMSVGGLMVMLALLVVRVTHGRDTPGDFVFEAKSECHFVNGSQRVRFLDRYSYNQQQFLHFDSDLGLFVADTELGERQAKDWNSDKAAIEQARTAVDRLCRYNYGVFEEFMQHRRLKPSVKVSLMDTEDPKNPHQLTCNVNGFYPYEITVHWVKNGQKDPGVVSSELLQNGDWTGQILVMLQTTIKSGDTFFCEVEHSSLPEPLRMEWRLETSESARNKTVTGIVGFVLGVIFITIGLVIYLKNKKGLRQLTSNAPEGVSFIN